MRWRGSSRRHPLFSGRKEREKMIACSKKNGFTLVELLIAMAVAAIVLTLIDQAYISQLKSHTTQQAVVEMHQNLRAALYVMERDVRMAGFNPLGSPAIGGITDNGGGWTSNSIKFTMDLTGGETDTVDNDNDGITDEVPESNGVADPEIEYDLLNRTLRRTVAGGSPQTIAENIDAVEFIYLDSNGDTTSVLADIRSVRIRLDASLPITAMVKGQANGNPLDMSLNTEIKCRNLSL